MEISLQYIHLWRSDYCYRDRFLQLCRREGYANLCEFTTAVWFLYIPPKHLPNIVTAGVIQGMEGKRIFVAKTYTSQKPTLVASPLPIFSSPYEFTISQVRVTFTHQQLVLVLDPIQMRSGNETIHLPIYSNCWSDLIKEMEGKLLSLVRHASTCNSACVIPSTIKLKHQ